MVGVTELGDVAHTLRIAAKVDYRSLPHGALGDVVADVQELKAQLASLEADVVSAYELSCEWRNEGHRTVTGAIRHRCRLAHREAATTVRLAKSLLRMPLVAERLRNAFISAAHARRLAKAASRPEFGDAEELLVGYAETMSFADFHKAVTYWEQVVDDNRPDPDPDRPDPREQNRSLHLSTTLSDMGRLDGWLDPVGNVTVAEALRRIERELFTQDWAAAKAEHGEAVTADKLWRSPEQRRADALVEMANRAMTPPADGRRPEPLVIVHIDAATFETMLIRLEGDADTPYPTDRLCELDDGTVLRPEQVLELAIAGRLRRIVYSSPGMILDYGRAQRFFTGALRQAIQARDRRCDHEGCEIPARQCDVDHIVEWDDGGTTVHTNGKARCSYHHRNHKPRPDPR